MKKLPVGVEIKNGWYQYRHRVLKQDRATSTIPHDNQGRAARVKLCPVSSPDSLLFSTLAAAKESYEHQADEEYLTLGWLHKKWKDHTPAGDLAGSRAYKGLASSTQRRYDTAAAILDHVVKINGQDAPFRQVRADQINTPTIRKILDKRFHSGETTANLNNSLAMIGSMYKFAIQYLPELKVTQSPTKNVQKFKTGKSTRYVTDEEYRIQHQIAGEVGRPYLQDYMELTYLLAARGCEVSTLKIGAATEQGIIVIRTKGSLDTGIRWTQRLRNVWESALNRHLSTHPDPHKNIIVTADGREIGKSTIDDAWGLVRNEMKSRGLGKIYFTAHALKFKGISDASDSKIAGQSEAMRMHYKVNVDWFDAPK